MSKEDEGREIWVNKFDEPHAQKFRTQVLRYVERLGEDAAIPIYIDSYGGQVDSLAKMIEVMKSVPNRFATIASGKAMSCGAILLSQGDMRWCGPLSRVMIHNIHSASWGDAYDKQQSSQEIMRMQRVFMGLLAENCGITFEELEEKIRATVSGKEIWLDAESALDFGIVDFIGTPMFSPIIQTMATPPIDKPRLTDDEKGVKRTRVKKKRKRKSSVRRKDSGR